MNVLLVSNSDLEGGAARAAYRLHQGLQQRNIASNLLVQSKSSTDRAVIAPKTRFEQGIARARLTIDTLPLKRYPHRQNTTFSVQWLPETIAARVNQLDPTIVNLHWINDAFVQIGTIAKLNRPLVWTLHDMWAFTGGCHYTYDCDRYLQSCGACPQLHSPKTQDLSRSIWQRKAQAWRSADLTIVALSHWMAKCARASSLFRDRRIEVIPNGIDTEIYRPIDKAIARDLLGLPQNKQLALFGAVAAIHDPRKGFQFLQPALQNLSRAGWRDQLELVVFGSKQPEHPPEFGMKVHYLGSFSDDLTLALVYSAADLFILPSTQENLANTVMEAMACGTPCVAFDIGGMPDLIEHQQTGYLARPYKIDDLAQGIAWVLDHPFRYHQLSARSRTKVEQEFTQARQARRYELLFQDLLNQPQRDVSAGSQPVFLRT